MTARRAVAYVWAAPTSTLGLALVAVAGARAAWRAGVLEACGPGVAWWFDLVAPRRGIVAMTLGHVVLGRDEVALDVTRAHERVHVAQCERWGAAFLPAYACASLVAWLRGGDAYLDNTFEQAAWRQAPVRASAFEPGPATRCSQPARLTCAGPDAASAGVRRPAPGAARR